MKKYFRYVNQWNVMFYALIILQLALGWEGDHYDWSNIWGAGLIWVLFILGYNSLDRELEINLTRAKERIAQENADL